MKEQFKVAIRRRHLLGFAIAGAAAAATSAMGADRVTVKFREDCCG